MLARSFVHLPGIGSGTEKKLWDRGIHDWERLKGEAPRVFKGERLRAVTDGLDASERALRNRDLHYFYRSLPRDHLWRLVPGHFDEIAYLDIETTGMGMPPAAESTTITFLFRGQLFQEHEAERKRKLLRKILDEALVLCTFFGEVFDVPFLQQEFGMPIEKAHIDLCFWLKRHGYHGGLKRVQKRFEDIPARESMDINGYDAVRLWRLHQGGMPGALDTLLAYNAEDTVVLQPLLVKAFNLEVERNPGLGLASLECPPLPPVPTRVCQAVYAALRGEKSERPPPH